jgi:anti-sigma-K factor RskA
MIVENLASHTLSHQLVDLANITANAALHRRPLNLAELEQLSLTLLNLSGVASKLEGHLNYQNLHPRADSDWGDLSTQMQGWRADVEQETSAVASINQRLTERGWNFRLNTGNNQEHAA